MNSLIDLSIPKKTTDYMQNSHCDQTVKMVTCFLWGEQISYTLSKMIKKKCS